MWRNSSKIIRKVPSTVGRNVLKQTQRGASGAASSGGGAAKAILYTTGAVAAGAGVTVGYACYDPEFRRVVEKNVPPAKDLFQKVLGEPRDSSKPLIDLPNVKQIGDKVTSMMPARKEQKEVNQSPISRPAVQEQPQSKTPSTPKKEEPSKDTAPVDQAKSSKEEEERKKEAELQKRMKERDEELARTKKKLEQQVQMVQAKMEDAVKIAVDAKLKAATMIDYHTNRVMKAVEVLKPDSNDPMWKAANDAYESMKHALKLDETSEKEARAQIEHLRTAINEGLTSKDTNDHPILTEASEALVRWSFQLEEAISKVKQAQTKQKITGEFRHLSLIGRKANCLGKATVDVKIEFCSGPRAQIHNIRGAGDNEPDVYRIEEYISRVYEKGEVRYEYDEREGAEQYEKIFVGGNLVFDSTRPGHGQMNYLPEQLGPVYDAINAELNQKYPL